MYSTIRWISVVCAVLLCATAAWAGTYSGGDGSETNPYQIATPADLIELSQTSADWGACFIQTADISFNADETQVDWDGDGVLEWGSRGNDRFGFSPIGDETIRFTGTYCAGNHVIKNMYIDRSGTVGLFSYVRGATITNLGLVECDVTGGSRVGALAGLSSSSTVTACYAVGSVTAEVSQTFCYAGGLVGYNLETPLTDCFATVDVSYPNGPGDQDEGRIGGLAGVNSRSPLTNCYASGEVWATYGYVGGLVGHSVNYALLNCYATGRVYVQTNWGAAGGLVGYSEFVETGHSIISNSYAACPMLGYLDTLGGLVGKDDDQLFVIASYYDSDIFSGSDNGRGLPLNTAEFADSSNFDSSWNIDYAAGADSDHPWVQDGAARPYFYLEADGDGDSVAGRFDNCPNAHNPDQLDSDGDGQGDVCDVCPNDVTNDVDGDGICGGVDNCPNDPDNDVDGDGVCGDVDNCPATANGDQTDSDGDGLGDVCDVCPNDADNDMDGDGICGDVDVCPYDADNDADGDGLCGDVDACPHDADNDADSDGICGDVDTCPYDADNDVDGDGICGDVDVCPNDADNDADADGVCGDVDNCPAIANGDQADADGDGRGDACDAMPNDPNWYSGGDGTEANPFVIATTEDLLELSQTSDDWDAYFIQTADIVFDADETRVDWDGDGVLEWGAGGDDTFGLSPIGNDGNLDGIYYLGVRFSGTYDGQGHCVVNMYINRPDSALAGLFGLPDGAEIKNLGVVNCAVSGGQTSAAGLVARSLRCVVTNCFATGAVQGESDVGGLVGGNLNSQIYNSWADVAASGTGNSIGGLVGRSAYDTSVIANCYATGTVAGTGTADWRIGGLVGCNREGAQIVNSYASGPVSGTTEVGGLVGKLYDAVITASYYDTETAGQSDTGKGIPLTTAEFADSGNFDSSWDIDCAAGPDADHPWVQDGAARPYLYWEDAGEPTLVELVSFTVKKVFWFTVIEWETATETDNAGFNLYRTIALDGERIQLNPALIPAAGSPTAGARYRYVDLIGGLFGKPWYTLEDIDTAGLSTMHGPVR